MKDTQEYLQWLAQLRTRLAKPLPAREAHMRMAPPQRFDDKYNYKPNASTKTGSVLILLYPQEGSIYLPLTLKAENIGVHSGQVSFPGGRKDPEDADIIHTALRETREEIGVTVPREAVVGELSTFYIPPSNYLVHPVVAAIDYTPEFVPSAYEVAEMITLDILGVSHTQQRKVREISAKYMTAEVPYYDLQGHTVWGATSMILSELLWIMEEVSLAKR